MNFLSFQALPPNGIHSALRTGGNEIVPHKAARTSAAAAAAAAEENVETAEEADEVDEGIEDEDEAEFRSTHR